MSCVLTALPQVEGRVALAAYNSCSGTLKCNFTQLNQQLNKCYVVDNCPLHFNPDQLDTDKVEGEGGREGGS